MYVVGLISCHSIYDVHCTYTSILIRNLYFNKHITYIYIYIITK